MESSVNNSVELVIVTAFVTALFTSVFASLFQYLLSIRQEKKQLAKDSLVLLLQPLFIRLKHAESAWTVTLISENDDPSEFLVDLPEFYKPLSEVLTNYLYLADDELANVSIKFLDWLHVERNNRNRFELMMNGNLNDTALHDFRTCVTNKYSIARKKHNKTL